MFVGDNNHGDIASMIERLMRERDAALYEIRCIREGFEGCCHTCEPVAALNQELRNENAKLRSHLRSLQNYVLDRIVETDEELGLL